MIKIADYIDGNYATKPTDAEKIFNLMQGNKDFTLSLQGIDIVSTAFFNKIFFLFHNENKWNTDKILDVLRLKGAEDIHKYAFSAAVDISYNNEK